ncbi:MAG: transglutaminase-like domain-containing protein [Candidatus Geothermincolia bacterium]
MTSAGRAFSNKLHVICAATLAALLTALLVAAVGCGGQPGTATGGKNLTVEQVKLKASDAGQGWKLDREVVADPADAPPDSTLSLLAGMGSRKVLNQFFSKGSDSLQVNLVELPDSKSANAAALLLSGETAGDNAYGARRNIAVEVISTDAGVKTKVLEALKAEPLTEDGSLDGETGVDTGEAQVSFDLACVDNIDYMKANDLSNYLESYKEGQPVDPAMKEIIDSTSFGNTVSLLTSSDSGLKGDLSVRRADYAFVPASTGSKPTDGVTTFAFDTGALKKKAGVPYVSISGTVTPVTTDLDSGDGTTLAPEQAQAWTASTSFWPTTDPAVQSSLKEAAGGVTGDADKVEALWRWVRKNIKYSGPAGTRYGTLKVLQQRFGRCWDLADVFVTLCRASGVPAREMAGWLAGKGGGAGHVWAQAWLAGKGWISVDCTSDRVGAGTDYVPFFATTDGSMPILYVKMPVLK